MRKKISVAHAANYSDIVNAASYNTGAVSLGGVTKGYTMCIVMAAGSTQVQTAITINGAAAPAPIVGTIGAGLSMNAYLVKTAAAGTCTVAVTLSGNASNFKVIFLTLQNVSRVNAFATQTFTGTNSVTIRNPFRGLAIAIAYQAANTTLAWTNATELGTEAGAENTTIGCAVNNNGTNANVTITSTASFTLMALSLH